VERFETAAALGGSTDTPSAPTSDQRAQGAGLVIRNKRSGIYHLPSCPDYNKVSEKNRQYFKTKEEAEKAGYRMARNCP
jgi:methylphosphotriester-DNA--protein-cysteine methyltransferase